MNETEMKSNDIVTRRGRLPASPSPRIELISASSAILKTAKRSVDIVYCHVSELLSVIARKVMIL